MLSINKLGDLQVGTLNVNTFEILLSLKKSGCKLIKENVIKRITKLILLKKKMETDEEY